MSDKKRSTITGTVQRLTEKYRNESLFHTKNGHRMPGRDEIIGIIKDLRAVVFPGYFGRDSCAGIFPEYPPESMPE